MIQNVYFRKFCNCCAGLRQTAAVDEGCSENHESPWCDLFGSVFQVEVNRNMCILSVVIQV